MSSMLNRRISIRRIITFMMKKSILNLLKIWHAGKNSKMLSIISSIEPSIIFSMIGFLMQKENQPSNSKSATNDSFKIMIKHTLKEKLDLHLALIMSYKKRLKKKKENKRTFGQSSIDLYVVKVEMKWNKLMKLISLKESIRR